MKSDSDQAAFLTECNALEGSILADMLQQAGIPFLQKGVLGAELVAKAGPWLERYGFYVPESCLPRARQVLADFRAPADEP